MRNKNILIIFIFIGILFSVSAQAKPIGEMELVSGRVKHIQDEAPVLYEQPVKQIEVNAGDRFITGPQTIVMLRLRGGAESIKLFSNTSFQVDLQDQKRTRTLLNTGKAYFSAAIAKLRTSFLVYTPTVSVGIKGTQFVLGTLPDKSYLLTTEGLVSFASTQPPELSTLVGAGYASMVQAGVTPTSPVLVPIELQQEILTSDDLAAFEKIDFGPPLGEGEATGATTNELDEALQSATETSTAADEARGDAARAKEKTARGSVIIKVP